MTPEDACHDLDVVAIGSPLLDVIEMASDDQLAQVGLEKGSMTLIDLVTANSVQEFMGAPRFVSGGSVANTTAGIAELGGTAGFVGALADDEIGRTYTENLRAAGVEFEPHYSESAAADGLGTGRCMVLITEDADRTMGTYLGAASTLSPEGVPTSFVARASVVLLEGYLWDVPAAKEAMRHAAATAHASEGSVALSLSDPFCVSRHQREFLDLLIDDVDILLGNEEELTMLFGASSHAKAARGRRGDRPARRHDPRRPGRRRADAPTGPRRSRRRRWSASSTRPGRATSSRPASSSASPTAWARCESTTLGGLCAAEVISHTGARPEADLKALAAAAGLLPA